MSATRSDGSGSRPRGAESAQLTVALTGVDGPVGPPLLARLRRAADAGVVRVLDRRRPARLPQGVEFRRADPSKPASLARALTGSDVVVHMAGEVLGLTLGEDALFDINVRAAHNTARAAAAAGVTRFVLLSSSVVYGIRSDNPQPLVETAEVRASARHFYARQKAQAELLVTRALAGTPTDLYILRPTAVLGPHAAAAVLGRTTPALRALAHARLRPGIPVPPVPLQFVHEEDVAQAIVLTIRGAGGAADTFNLSAEDVVGGHEVLERLGLRPLPIPRVLVEAGLRAAVAGPQFVPATGWPEVFTEPLLTDAGKARRALGWEPHYSSRAALDATRQAIGW